MGTRWICKIAPLVMAYMRRMIGRGWVALAALLLVSWALPVRECSSCKR